MEVARLWGAPLRRLRHGICVAKMLDNTSSIICAFGLAAAAPRSPYRHLELCGIALKRANRRGRIENPPSWCPQGNHQAPAGPPLPQREKVAPQGRMRGELMEVARLWGAPLRRLRHGICVLPKCSIIHPVLSALLA